MSTNIERWGAWSSLWLSLVVLAVFLIFNTVVAVAFLVLHQVQYPNVDFEQNVTWMASSGLVMAVASLVSTFPAIGMIYLFSWMKRRRKPLEYLNLSSVSLRVFAFWIGATITFAILSDVLTVLLNKPIVPDVMVTMFETAGSRSLLFLAVVFAAPLFEEALFRGFLLPGIQSRWGPAWAVVLTAAGWSVLHFQYDLYGILTIFAGGVMLGLARILSGSTYVTMILHSLWNFIAFVEVAFHVHEGAILPFGW
ncbi:MAG TPA: type II CAAX endopeptidase family protein [Thermoanaerobaculia bacterium]|nr:type II CAAX endopeptidase family protein [Thermoanaerobaculia bacterium]HUM29236.1 type II CAAX endopeptidase family protein [Thermoanaerobaculia bacterium]HXK67805.1 type II CAAX endopeptidase family protein [Thermoanaerobaculia bacterium]